MRRAPGGCPTTRRSNIPIHSANSTASPRPRGVFSRQVTLGDALDTDNIHASYHSGMLRLNIPVAEKAKPRKIAIESAERREAIDA